MAGATDDDNNDDEGDGDDDDDHVEDDDDDDAAFFMNPHVEEAHGGNARGTEASCHALASSCYPGSQLLQAAAAG